MSTATFINVLFCTLVVDLFLLGLVTDCCLTPIQQFFSSMKWWWWSPLCTSPTCWICIVLAYWNNSPGVYMSLHSDTLFWLQANESLLFLLNVECLAEKQQNSNCIVFCLTRPGFEPTIYHTRGKHVNHYATDAVIFLLEYFTFTIHLKSLLLKYKYN